VVICLEQSANNLHMIQLMPLSPIITCFIKIQNGSAFLVPAYPGCTGKRLLKGCSSSCIQFCCKFHFHWPRLRQLTNHRMCSTTMRPHTISPGRSEMPPVSSSCVARINLISFSYKVITVAVTYCQHSLLAA